MCVPPYTLGGDHEARLDAAIAALGGTHVGMALPGDLLVVARGIGPRHLAVVIPDWVIHAHAGLGRVVEGLLDPA